MVRAAARHPMSKILASLRREGISVTARKVVSAAREPWFDLVHRTDTRGRIEVATLDVRGPNVEHACGYEPTGHHELKALLRRLDLFDDGGVFVDFGCGKGRVLLLATDYPFDRIVGVEFSLDSARWPERTWRPTAPPPRREWRY